MRKDMRVAHGRTRVSGFPLPGTHGEATRLKRRPSRLEVLEKVVPCEWVRIFPAVSVADTDSVKPFHNELAAANQPTRVLYLLEDHTFGLAVSVLLCRVENIRTRLVIGVI